MSAFLSIKSIHDKNSSLTFFLISNQFQSGTMALHLYTSNRMEMLVDSLAEVVRQPLASVFEHEVIVVQSRGMQRWLSMELAGRFGVWANGRYPFPNAMVQELFKQLLPSVAQSDAFKKEVMSWRVMRLLPHLLEMAEFLPLRRYAADDSDGLKLFQLSEKIADTFDQYTLFRPDMLALWEAGGGVAEGGEAWQPLLWRALVEGAGLHRGQLRELLFRQLSRSSSKISELPERITLFGISYLPQFHLELFAAVARLTEVHLFLLSPTQEYWGDIVSRKAMARLSEAEQALRSEGNPLLASLGRIGRDFSEMVLEMSDEALDSQEFYDDPPEDSLLHALQWDILHLQGAGEMDETPRLLQPHDRSVQIHACHTPLREVEVLYDAILGLLEAHPHISLRDIIVMTPDIESYSPYIATVFGTAREAGKEGKGVVALPFSIADRRMMHEGEIASALLKLLALHGSRLTASMLFDFLASPPVSRAFGFDAEALRLIRGWIEGSGIRWGMDEEDRRERNLPAYRDHSWRAGLERLLLGYAMPEEEQLFQGVLPYGDIAGSAAEMLGRFAEAVEALERFVSSSEPSRTLEAWRQQYAMWLTTFFAPDEDSEREFATLATLGEELAEYGINAGFEENISPLVFFTWLRSRLEEQEQGLGFMTGGITFCAMLPMRSIPFRVVMLIGMNDGAFPRQSRAPSFDLITRQPQKGDRSLRNEDRYLFLESILSARELLYISYVGQSIRDNSEIPPSVLVSELLDAVRRAFVLPNESSIEQHLVVRHRLQPFHHDYFSEHSPLASYSSENYYALIASEQSLQAVPPIRSFISTALSEPTAEWRTVQLEQLLHFYDNPSAFFLEQRLGIKPEGLLLPLQDSEPFAVESLERYRLQQELLEAQLRGQPAEALLPLFKSRGMLPPAQHGELLFATVMQEVDDFAATLRQHLAGEVALAPLEVDIEVGEFRIVGRLDGIWANAMLRYRPARMKVRDRFRWWIEHLLLCALQPTGYPLTTHMLMSDGEWSYPPIDNPHQHLTTLLQRYWQGLCEPLPFFPRSAYAFVLKGMDANHHLDVGKGIDAAYREWRDDTFTNRKGEGSDSAIQRCFGAAANPFSDTFIELALELFTPMMEAMGAMGDGKRSG
uniref:RecBCD enzyme subunit RecC n=1 Tax=Chlorobium chlorochromatii (strain CaD3) TaxID=340177 RepID=Q3ASJ4_CHLCH